MKLSDGRKDKTATAMVNKLVTIIPANSSCEQLRHCLESPYSSHYSVARACNQPVAVWICAKLQALAVDNRTENNTFSFECIGGK
jgi:hypothetical protein